jgi:competence protein ComGC
MKKAYSIAELLVSLMIWVVIIVLFAPTLIKKVEKPTQIKVKQEKIKYDYDFSN